MMNHEDERLKHAPKEDVEALQIEATHRKKELDQILEVTDQALPLLANIIAVMTGGPALGNWSKPKIAEYGGAVPNYGDVQEIINSPAEADQLDEPHQPNPLTAVKNDFDSIVGDIPHENDNVIHLDESSIRADIDRIHLDEAA